MNAVRVLLRAELRRRWASWIATALLIGIAGAVVLGAFAGARRTASVISRSARQSRAEDLSIGPDVQSTPPEWARLDGLPGVASIGTGRGLIAVPIVHGRPDLEWLNTLTVFPDREILRTIGRPQMLAGRLPRADRVDEMFVNETFAQRFHVHVGQRYHLVVVTPGEFDAARRVADLPAGRELDVRVAGIGRMRDEGLRDPSDPQLLPEAVYSPAASARFASLPQVTWDGKWVRLRRPGRARVAVFERRVRDLLQGTPVVFGERRAADARASRAMRPYVVTLLAFGLLAGVTSIAVIGQLLGRREAARRDERRVLHSMGVTRSGFALQAAVEGLVIGSLGAAIAVAGAIALSPLAPLGPLRRLEPHPGLTVDARTLGVGAVLLVTLVVARLALAASRRITPSPTRQVNRLADAVARRVPASVGTGIRLGTQGRASTGSVPLRSTMVGLCTAIAAISATLVFSAGLHHFITTPRLYGWTWDALVVANDGSNPKATVTKDPAVGSTALGAFGQVVLRDASIPALGIDGSPGIEIVHGRRPAHADEVAIGITSLHAARAHVGEHVEMSGATGSRRYLVTGVAVFPRLAPYPAAEPTGLGTGAAFTRVGLRRLVPDAPDRFVLVRFRRPPTSEGAARTRRQLASRLFPNRVLGSVLGPQRPNDVTSYDRVARTPLALAGLLALLALATAAHVLVTSVRRRRSELAVLKTLGFSRRQVSTSVATQATTMIALAALIAVPIGTAVGMWAWGGTARWLGIPVEQSVPLGALAGTVVVAILLANVIAFVPGRMAARIRPSVALRAE